MLLWRAPSGDSGAKRKVRLVVVGLRNTSAPSACRARRNKPSQRKEPRLYVGKAWRCLRRHKCQDGRRLGRQTLMAISGAYQVWHEHKRSSMSSFKTVFDKTRRTYAGASNERRQSWRRTHGGRNILSNVAGRSCASTAPQTCFSPRKDARWA